MATKTKKQQVKHVTQPAAAKPRKIAKEPLLTAVDILPLGLIFLYLFVDFIPRFDAADVMGAQWIYLIIVNVLSAVYIFLTRKTVGEAITSVSKSWLAIIFTALYLLAGFSIIVAMNKIESFVTYSRFTTTFLAFWSMAILLYNRPNFFKIFAQILSAFLLIQSIDLLNQFFAGFDTMSMTELVNNLKSNSGNKNIMAASLVMKVPFAAYCIFTQKTAGKIINTTILTLAALTIFFVNARASFLSLILVSVIVAAYLLYDYFSEKNIKLLLQKAGMYFIPLVLMFVLANIILESKKEFEEQSSNYGSVTERLSTLSLEKQKNSLRMNQYKSALSYIKDHPFMGSGFGNWKLVSIPYERNYSDEMYISYHVHNDFLETTAELGFGGGLLYAALYFVMAFIGLSIIFSRAASRQLKQMAAFALMALSVYFIDAMFNFPLERPIMQMYLAFILALHLNLYISFKKQATTTQRKFSWAAIVYSVIVLGLMIPSYYYSRNVYKSMIAQGMYNADMLSGSPVYKSAQVIPSLPDIPDLNVFGFPIDAIKARYLLAEKRYDESLAYLNKSMHVNPYITYNEFLKGNLFLERRQLDSAYFYAKKAFFMKPRAKSNFELFGAVLSQTKDSAMATRAFKETLQFRDEPWLWDDYINILYACGKDYKSLFLLADTAAKKFPDDPKLKQKQKELGQLQNVAR